MASPDNFDVSETTIATEQLISLDDWLVAGTPADAAVAVASDADLDAHYAALARVESIVMALPAFADGRAFSHARKLRDLGFAGELLAAGDVLPDQWQFLKRCGFTGLVDERLADEAFGLRVVSQVYQADEQQRQPVFRRAPRA